ncbi:MAG: tyrosine-type recombinase/integrase [Pseudomonadota bacterium]|nr:tyrosine-type recombinase/integrase [Pseudomonadota bacterium]
MLRPNTAVRYARALDLFLRYLDKVHGKGATFSPALLTRRLLSEWYADLKHDGLHGNDRSDATRRKLVEVVQLAWVWLYDDEESSALVAPPRKLRMAREPSKPTVAPTWAEMDACVAVLRAWHQRLGVVLRFTGLRCQQAMGLRWADVDLTRARLTVRGELGKSRQEQRGRVMPISPHLVAILRTWEREGEWLISSNRQSGDRERMARARDFERGWQRASVRQEAYDGRPHHAFRKGFVSELKRAGADADAVEFLVGHSLGLRGVYIDPDALPLKAAVEHIPVLSLPANVPGDVRFEGDGQTDGPMRLILMDDEERRDLGYPPRPRRDPVCPGRVPAGHRVRGKVLSMDAFRKNGGGGGSRTTFLGRPPMQDGGRLSAM